jgi:SpoIID/LytB domain protein
VAARTYALANAAQFDEDGYDICATPRCQAYGGAASEHPLSDRAVALTNGQIATWQGRPIDALYTAIDIVRRQKIVNLRTAVRQGREEQGPIGNAL